MGNIIDDYADSDLSEKHKAEVQRYIELVKDIQREDAALKVQDLARQMMAYATVLSDDDAVEGARPFQSEESTRNTVRSMAELIHSRVARSRHQS